MKNIYTYQILGTQKGQKGHFLYHLMYKRKDGGEIYLWVGIHRLKILYGKGKIKGHIPELIKRRMGIGSRNEVGSRKPRMYKLPDVFEVDRNFKM